MPNFFRIVKEDFKLLVVAVLISFFAFFGSYYVYASGETPTLSVTVQTAISVVITTDNFANLTPDSPVWATSTLAVNTNNAAGWYITLSGDNKTESVNVMTSGGYSIPDPTNEWSVAAGTATSTGGNAATITSGDDYLYFRVMIASGSPKFWSGWWGSDDDVGSDAKWAGIASSTNVSKIGRTMDSSGGSVALNTVLYYIDVAGSQETATYTGNLTYTITGN